MESVGSKRINKILKGVTMIYLDKTLDEFLFRYPDLAEEVMNTRQEFKDEIEVMDPYLTKYYAGVSFRFKSSDKIRKIFTARKFGINEDNEFWKIL